MPRTATISYVTAPTTGDSYVAPAGVGIGSGDFIAAVWYRPSFGIADIGTNRPIFQAKGGAGNGWRFQWNFNVAQMIVADGGGVDFGGNFGGNLFWGSEPGYPQERDVLFVARITGGGGGGTARLRYYINGAQLFDNPAAAPGVTQSTTPLTLGGTVGGSAMSGGIQGAAYMNGTLTDAQLLQWTMDSLDANGLIDGAPAWTGLWSTLLTGAPGATFPDSSGNGNNLSRVGAPSTQQRTIRLG